MTIQLVQILTTVLLITWTPYNASYYKLLKSYDGTNFQTLALLDTSITEYEDHADSLCYYTVNAIDSNGHMVAHSDTALFENTQIGIKNNIVNKFNIWPNPIIDKLNIFVTKRSAIKIYNILGQTILDKNINIGHTQIKLNYAPGLYILRINNKNFKIIRK